MEVYERLSKEDEANAPELVISGRSPYRHARHPHILTICSHVLVADTVIIFPPQEDIDPEDSSKRVALGNATVSRVLEKPMDANDQVRK